MDCGFNFTSFEVSTKSLMVLAGPAPLGTFITNLWLTFKKSKMKRYFQFEICTQEAI